MRLDRLVGWKQVWFRFGESAGSGQGDAEATSAHKSLLQAESAPNMFVLCEG